MNRSWLTMIRCRTRRIGETCLTTPGITAKGTADTLDGAKQGHGGWEWCSAVKIDGVYKQVLQSAHMVGTRSDIAAGVWRLFEAILKLDRVYNHALYTL